MIPLFFALLCVPFVAAEISRLSGATSHLLPARNFGFALRANGDSCPGGWGVCPNFSTECAPVGSQCCSATEYCDSSNFCCNDSLGGCCPIGSFCTDGSYSCTDNGGNGSGNGGGAGAGAGSGGGGGGNSGGSGGSNGGGSGGASPTSPFPTQSIPTPSLMQPTFNPTALDSGGPTVTVTFTPDSTSSTPSSSPIFGGTSGSPHIVSMVSIGYVTGLAMVAGLVLGKIGF